jgi:hypothetical protein
MVSVMWYLEARLALYLTQATSVKLGCVQSSFQGATVWALWDRLAYQIILVAKVHHTLPSCVRMATACPNQAAFARTAIVHSVCRVSVSGTFVPNKLVETVKTESHVKLECPAKSPRLFIVLVLNLPATSMPDKAAKA